MPSAADSLAILGDYGQTDSSGAPIVSYPNVVPRITVAPLNVTAPTVTGGVDTKLDILNKAITGKLEERPTLPPPPANERDIRAGTTGFATGASFGALPAMVGVQQAGQEANAPMAGVPSEAPGMEAFGLGLEKLRAGDPAAIQAYHMGRRSVVEQQNQAWQNDPWMYAGGNLASMVVPGMGLGAGVAATAENLGARVLGGIGTGAAAGGLYGAGTTVSEGGSTTDVAKNAAIGATLGGVTGGMVPAIPAAVRAVSPVIAAAFNKVTEPLRALRNTDETAAGKIASALRYDAGAGGLANPQDIGAARAAGQPVGLIDLGNEATRALGESAVNTSPGARSALQGLIEPRFASQQKRAAEFVRGFAPVQANAAKTQEMIEGAARKANDPAYKRAYAAGDRPIWSPELERLTSSPDVAGAVRGAVNRWKSFQVKDGYGGVNPPLRITDDGRMVSTGGNGMPTYPNIQLWDYAQRNLSGMAAEASRSGNKTNAGLYGGLADQLKTELDRLVPEYGEARKGAARFFGAENALEAGQKFLTSDLNEAELGYAKLSPVEKQLFAEGFVSSLVDRVQKIGDNRSLTIDRIFRSVDGRARIDLALGPNRATQLEMYLRRENMLDQARKIITGKSTTLRQMFEHGLAGGIAGGGLESIEGGDWKDPKRLIAAVVGGVIGLKTLRINQNLARRVGEMLASDDPKVWGQVLDMASRSAPVADTIRTAETALEKLARPVRATPFENQPDNQGQEGGQ